MDAQKPVAPRPQLQGAIRALGVALVLVMVVILVGAVCRCAAKERRSSYLGHRASTTKLRGLKDPQRGQSPQLFEHAVNRPWRHSSSRRRGLPYFRPPSHYLASQIARPFRHDVEVVQETPTSHVVALYDSPWWPGVKWRRDELFDVLFPENRPPWAAT